MFDPQLLSQCVSTCMSRSVPEVHYHAVGTLSNQPTPTSHGGVLLLVPLRYWQSDNRTSAAVLPHLRATQKGNLARPHSRSPQAVRKPEGLAVHCHLHRGDWSFHLTNEKKKKCARCVDIASRLFPWVSVPSAGLCRLIVWWGFLFAQWISDFLIRTVDIGLSYSYSGYRTFLFVQWTSDFLIRTEDFGLSYSYSGYSYRVYWTFLFVFKILAFLIRTGDTGLSYSCSGYWLFLFVQWILDFLIRAVDVGLPYSDRGYK